MTLAEMKKHLKTRFPFLSYVYTSGRYLREITQTVGLINRVIKTGGFEEPDDFQGTIVINSVRTYIPIQVTTESMIALKLRQRGYRVVMLYDDQVLRHHDTLYKADFAPWQTYYPERRRASLALLKRLHPLAAMLTPYSEFLRDFDLERARQTVEDSNGEYFGVSLDAFIRDSLVRFFVSVPDEKLLSEEPDYERARQMFVDNCILSLQVAQQVHRALKPDMVVTSHGIYTTWGPFMNYMVNQRVRSVTCGCNVFNINGLDLSVDQVAAAKTDDGYLDHFVNDLLDRDIPSRTVVNKVDQYMERRFSGASKDTERLRHGEDDSEQILNRIRQARDQGKIVFAMFPNIMWDSATTFKDWNRVFDSPVQWLVETTKHFAAADDKMLVIRVHPGEYTVTHVRKSVRDILEYYLGPEIFANPNIVFVPAAARLPSYRMFDLIDGGVVYNGTIALELVHYGKPVIIGAKAAYSDKGFTWDIVGREKYFEAFERTDDILKVQNENMDMARYFIYEYFFLHGVPVELMSTERFLSPNVDAEPERIWKDRNLDHIVSVMVGEEKYFQDYWRKKGD